MGSVYAHLRMHGNKNIHRSRCLVVCLFGEGTLARWLLLVFFRKCRSLFFLPVGLLSNHFRGTHVRTTACRVQTAVRAAGEAADALVPRAHGER